MKLILQAIKALFRKIEASRTHWDTRQTVTEKLSFDGVLEGREVFVMDESTKFVKVSDNPPAIEDVIGGKITFYDYEYGEIPPEKITEDFIFSLTDTVYAVGDALVVLADTDMGGPVIQKGVWFMCAYEDAELVLYVSSLEYTYTTGELKRLDEKYLPEGVVEAISNANVQGDWSQNDDTQPDYIKSRTHYKVGIGEYVCFEEHLSIGATQTVPIECQIPVGTSIKVYYDDALSATLTTYLQDDRVFAGDGRFNIYFDENTVTVANYNYAAVVKIVAVDVILELKTLDDVFIPDTIAREATLVAKKSTGAKSVIVNDLEGNVASGQWAFAEGRHNTASGWHAHAEGENTSAKGNGSHTEGSSTIAGSRHQHVQGRYNIEDTSEKYAHIVGNGASGTERSNAHTLDWNGNAWFAGTIKVGGTGQDDEAAKEVALKEDVGAYIIDLTDLWDGSSVEVTIDTISYDDFAEHWYNGGALVIRHAVDGVGVMYYYPELVIYYDGGLAVCVKNGSEPYGFNFTNGTWTPPTE